MRDRRSPERYGTRIERGTTLLVVENPYGIGRGQRRPIAPWRVDAADYRAALAAADAEGASLPFDPQAPGPTPWSPPLRECFERERRVVHQERLLAQILAP